MRRTRVITGTALLAVVMAAIAVATAAGAQPTASTLVVDRDRMQCANAGFTSIQAAVDAAQAGDLVRVCPDHYDESVIIDKPLTIKGDPDAIEALDCFDPTPAQPGDLDPTRQAILDPAGDGFTIALSLRADDVAVAGLVVEGASVGIDASDRFSGYRVHHNLIRLNTLFGLDFGSEGTRESRVDHNCLRENRWGVVSELDDDSLWSVLDGEERKAFPRDLDNARIDHNDTFQNSAGVDTAGPGQRDRVTIDRNTSRQDGAGIIFQNSTGSAIVNNEITDARGNAIVIGGGNENLVIAANQVRASGLNGIVFVATGFLDLFPVPSKHVFVQENNVRSAARAGILVSSTNLVDSEITDNISRENAFSGINLQAGNTRNLVRNNHADNNVLDGIIAAGATGNRFEHNSMHGNDRVDARDLNRPLNIWIANDCLTDFPAGTICGIG